MLEIDYDANNGGWGKPKISEFGNLSLVGYPNFSTSNPLHFIRFQFYLTQGTLETFDIVVTGFNLILTANKQNKLTHPLTNQNEDDEN